MVAGMLLRMVVMMRGANGLGVGASRGVVGRMRDGDGGRGEGDAVAELGGVQMSRRAELRRVRAVCSRSVGGRSEMLRAEGSGEIPIPDAVVVEAGLFEARSKEVSAVLIVRSLLELQGLDILQELSELRREVLAQRLWRHARF